MKFVSDGVDLSPAPLFDRQPPRLLGIFAAWRLRAYSLGIAVVYSVVFIHVFHGGGWIVSRTGAPLYTDFSTAWVVGVQALHGNLALLYDPAEFLKIQTALLGAQKFLYPNWPYPPTFSLILAPFALMPYLWSFVSWTSITLLGCITIVYLIVRRSPAIPLVLASPFTAWNIMPGQTAFLTASLLGASLLFLERQPILAGVFIGCLTYKPQFGILIPVALAASKQWRAVASAVATAGLLAGASVGAFGASAWEAFPRGLFQQFGVVLDAEGVPDVAANWGYLQTIYGLIRYLHGGATLAWAGQAVVALCAALVVWRVWGSLTRYALKAAILSAAALLASPYAFAYDMAAIAVPVAFLARDQMRCGLLRGEQTALLGLFGVPLALLVIFRDPPDGIPFGSLPGIGPAVLIVLLTMILRRILVSFGRGLSWPKPAAVHIHDPAIPRDFLKFFLRRPSWPSIEPSTGRKRSPQKSDVGSCRWFHQIKDLHMIETLQTYILQLISRLRRDDEGAALVEYGMLVGLIAVICVVAVTTLGTEVSAAFSKIASSLAGV